MNGPIPILTTPTAATSPHTRLIDTVNDLVAAALRQTAMGERVTYEAALQMAGGPNGQPVPVVAIYLQIPSPLLGQALYDMSVLEAAQANEQAINHFVAGGVARLFEARNQVRAIPITN